MPSPHHPNADRIVNWKSVIVGLDFRDPGESPLRCLQSFVPYIIGRGPAMRRSLPSRGNRLQMLWLSLTLVIDLWFVSLTRFNSSLQK